MKKELGKLMVGDQFQTLATLRFGRVVRWFKKDAVPVRLLNPVEDKIVSGHVIVEFLPRPGDER